MSLVTSSAMRSGQDEVARGQVVMGRGKIEERSTGLTCKESGTYEESVPRKHMARGVWQEAHGARESPWDEAEERRFERGSKPWGRKERKKHW